MLAVEGIFHGTQKEDELTGRNIKFNAAEM